jgi:hypothetical protein
MIRPFSPLRRVIAASLMLASRNNSNPKAPNIAFHTSSTIRKPRPGSSLPQKVSQTMAQGATWTVWVSRVTRTRPR